MPEGQTLRRSAVAQKWCELADRRCAHVAELYHSGRWRHYYTEHEFLAWMREVKHTAEVWHRLAASGAGDRRTEVFHFSVGAATGKT